MPLPNTRFWKRGNCKDAEKLLEQFKAYEAAMEERLKAIDEALYRLIDHVNKEIGVSQDVPLHARVAQLDKDDDEIQQTLSAEIESVRKLALAGSITADGSKLEEGSLTGARPVFTQRRSAAIARSSAPQAMLERMLKTLPGPEPDKILEEKPS